MIQTRNIKFVLKIYIINFPIYKLSVLLNILHEKSNKVFQEPDWLLFHFETQRNLFYLFSFFFISCATPDHSLSPTVICYTIRLSFYKRLICNVSGSGCKAERIREICSKLTIKTPVQCQ